MTSEPLGIYKHAMYVSEDGYLWTNAFDVANLYYIGESAAQKIIKYAKNNSEKADYEPFYNSIVGKITEITNEYIVIDDSILCKDPKDGIKYKVMAQDMVIYRYIATNSLKVGMTVQVIFMESLDNENTVYNALDINECVIYEDSVLIPA